MTQGETPQAHPSLAGSTLVDALRLSRTEGVGPITFFHLIRRFGSAADALNALPELAARGGRKKPLVAFARDKAEKEIEATHAFGARLLVYGEADYPQALLPLPDAPPVLSLSGNVGLWKNNNMVSVVGARNASANGCQFAQKLSRELGAHGMVVVSGLARGIDSFAHRGALPTGTVGVIAGGIDTIYPPENETLFAQLREQGAILSEQPFGSAPFAGSFPGRNRIIAGLGLGTLVVEASPKSGSLITARMAAEYGKEVLAVPGSPLDPHSRGCNQLLRQGATMVENVDDIIQAVSQVRVRGFAEASPAHYAHAQEAAYNSEELQALVLEKVGATAVLVDELIEQCQTPAGELLGVLLELELAGKLQRSAGNKVYKTLKQEEEVA
jgi:DNA processing protein